MSKEERAVQYIKIFLALIGLSMFALLLWKNLYAS